MPQPAGQMPARWVNHTVGPVKGMNGDRDAELLAAAYRNSLQVAEELRAISIAFPAISTGVFGYPKYEAAAIASREIEAFLKENETIKVVRLVFFSNADARTLAKHRQFSAVR